MLAVFCRGIAPQLKRRRAGRDGMSRELESMQDSRRRVSDVWTEPGAHEVAEGVYRLPLPLPQDGLRAVNVYVIETEQGLLVIDGGWAVAESRLALEKALGSIGHAVADVCRFVVTHMHRDHYTQAVAIRREFGAKVALGIGERDSLRVAVTTQGRAGQAQLDQLGEAGAAALVPRLIESGFGSNDVDVENLEPPDEWLSGEQTIIVSADRSLRAMHTPGHTRGHLVFVDLQNGLLFSGDHVLPHITPSIGFEPAPAHLPLRDYLDSLRRVRAMPDMRLLPAHGLPGTSVHDRVDELLIHHDNRLQACLDNVTPAGSTGYEVALGLPWTSRHRSLGELDPFNQMLAVCETVAHLDLLVETGRLGSQDHRGKRVFHP